MIPLYQTAHTPNYHLLRKNANRMRKEPTEAENALWKYVRSKQLGLRFYRQHIIGNYIVDLVCLEKKLIIEIDGKYHSDGGQQESDELRERTLNQYGYEVLRFTNEEVLCNMDNILCIIKNKINN